MDKNTPYFPTTERVVAGITIYEQAVLLFMVETSKHWLDADMAAGAAVALADAYLNKLSSTKENDVVDTLALINELRAAAEDNDIEAVDNIIKKLS